MTVDPKSLEQFDGKQVVIHLVQEDNSVRECLGKVEAASEQGMAFKEKGKREVELIMPEQIEEIALAPEKPKTLAQKKLKPVTETAARQHLLDRHGYLRSEINAMDEGTAFELHENLDHADLGHRHVEPEDDSENGDEQSDED